MLFRSSLFSNSPRLPSPARQASMPDMSMLAHDTPSMPSQRDIAQHAIVHPNMPSLPMPVHDTSSMLVPLHTQHTIVHAHSIGLPDAPVTVPALSSIGTSRTGVRVGMNSGDGHGAANDGSVLV